MGQGFDDWMHGCFVLVISYFALFDIGLLLQAISITVPAPVGRVLGFIMVLLLVRLVLNAIFD